jgi:hypothetical protein
LHCVLDAPPSRTANKRGKREEQGLGGCAYQRGVDFMASPTGW